MKVVHLGLLLDAAHREPAALMQAWPTQVAVAEAAAGAGCEIAVFQACHREALLERDGVRHRFMPIAAMARALAGEKPDLLHVHGLQFGRELLALPRLPTLLQDHANAPPRRPLPWLHARRSFSRSRGLLFCASEQALPFRRRGLLSQGTRVHEVAESSSSFAPMDRAAVRGLTGLAGDPALLWVGHLDDNKDPLTVLEGVALAAERLAQLQLWCCFGQAPLLHEVQQRIATDARLAGRVHLLGPQPHERIELLMNAADFLVQGSHREGSGYALIEALACGLTPLVSDIPSFRALTGRGTVGRLWPCGDAGALAQAITTAATEAREPMRRRARAHFEALLSPAALGQRLRSVYEQALS
ncbi:MAG: glycosyltransferase family 4 protein [Paucibacter sp.]|nr:glycosyltransferase family 4 protein [Roseateles sp.]